MHRLMDDDDDEDAGPFGRASKEPVHVGFGRGVKIAVMYLCDVSRTTCNYVPDPVNYVYLAANTFPWFGEPDRWVSWQGLRDPFRCLDFLAWAR